MYYVCGKLLLYTSKNNECEVHVYIASIVRYCIQNDLYSKEVRLSEGISTHDDSVPKDG